MHINKTGINYRDWKTKVIIGYVLIIALFCITTSWILFATVPNAVFAQFEKQIDSVAKIVQTTINESEDLSLESFKTKVDNFSKDSDYQYSLYDQSGSLILQSVQESQSEQSENTNVLLNSSSQSTIPNETVDASGPLDDFFFNKVFFDDSAYSIEKKIEVQIDGNPYELVVKESASSYSNCVTSIQVFGFGLLLAVLLVASLLSYWSYGAALNSVEQTERTLSSFMANSSHEMKTPVASIKLMSESITIAANRGQTDYVKEFAYRIEQSANHLDQLVRDMLSITRAAAPLKVRSAELESGPETSVCTVGSVLHEALFVQRSLAEKKRLDLEMVLEPDIDDVTVDLSEQDFLTIINNLVGNAIAYTDEGSIRIEANHSKDQLVLRVIDTGCGIAPHDHDRVFERFYRVDSTRVSYSQGTGLGLPLVSNIVANANGRIWLKSSLGEGSIFTVVLPCRIRGAEARHGEKQPLAE